MLRYLFPLLLLAANSSGQTIEENKTDEFTGARIVSTNWDWLNYGAEATLYTRIRFVNGRYSIHVKYAITGGRYGVIFSIRNDDQFMLKLANDTIVKLKPISGEVSCQGCGATGFIGSAGYGTHTIYPLTPEQIELLYQYPIIKTRMYTSDGYVDMEVNPKKINFVRDALKLLLGR